ncbi:MAG: tandem-95 repeat protein [Phycisphaerales bacterium]|nr:tandem-95 repeat protein [Phycisphaerales bacterium]
MCKTVLFAGIAALSVALPASAQSTRLAVQVSSDNVNWSDSMFAPAGSVYFVRVVASTNAPNAVGLHSITFQPTLTGWTSADLRLPFTSTSGGSVPVNAGVPANTGRMAPFGSASMASGSTPGLLTSFVDGGSTLRLAGSRATTMTSNLAYGVVSSQNSNSVAGGFGYNASTSEAVVLKYAVQLSGNPTLRTMTASVPLTSIQSARGSWFTSLATGTGNPQVFSITSADITPATIHVGPPNFPPVAVNDTFSMIEGQTLFVTASSILDNDTDADAGDTKVAELVSTTARGTLTLNANGTFSYIPQPFFNGADTFTYRVRDRFDAASNVATVTINVANVNQPPDVVASDPTAVNEDSGARVIPGWATISAGPDENWQNIDMIEVVDIEHPEKFAVLPTVSPDGTLRYTPAADTNGESAFHVRVRDNGGTDNGGSNEVESASFTISVVPVNDAPIFSAAPVSAVLEDSGQRSIANWASFNPGPNEGDQALLGYIVSNVTNPSLFAVQPTIAPDGTLVYTPAPNASGTSSFTVAARDNGGTANGGADTSSGQTFTVTISPVNDAPAVTVHGSPTVFEDSSVQTVNGFVSFNAGGAGTESGQGVSAYLISNISNPAFFASGPSISNSGTLTYTPAANASGTATFEVRVRDNGGSANGGVDTSGPAQATITVAAVNDAPSFVAAIPAAVNEDSGPVSVGGWAAFNAGPGESEQAVLAYSVLGISNSSLFSSLPAVSADGTLTYTPAPNAFGSSSFQVRVRDNGGTLNGGADTSGTQSFSITVNPVNDAPTVTLGSAPTIIEDGGPQTVFGYASFNEGAANESSQSIVQYIISGVSNPAMFANGPSISNTGVLTYTPAPNASGVATFQVQVRDNGGTANAGVDTSSFVQATITITDINDPPTFTAVNPTGDEDSGPVVMANWANFNPGPFESAQSALAYTVSNVSNPGLFSSPPSVSPDGTLSYTTVLNASGISTFQVRVRDNGGTGSGGIDVSGYQTFTITVAAVNDPPVVTLNPIPMVNEDVGMQVVPSFASATGGAPNESGQAITEYVITDVSNPAAFAAGPAVSPAGVLFYTPVRDASGVLTFKVQARDNGGTDNGGRDLSDPITATLTINGTNDAPVARARDITLDARGGCVPLDLPAAVINDGSFDVDNPLSELTITINHTGEFRVGSTPVRLTVSDVGGLSSYADAVVTVLGADSNSNGVPDTCDQIRGGGGPDCDEDGDFDESLCQWDNGSASPLNGRTNGQLSQYGGNPSARVADDFYLRPGFLYHLTSFRAQIVTNSIERGARMSLFEDCDGAPVGEPFFTLDTVAVASESPTSDPAFTLVTYVFELCEDKLVLDGGKTYWLSVQGKVNCNETDQAFWASVGITPSPRDLLASVPVKAFGDGPYPCDPAGYQPWESIADCCIGCVNMAYLITGEACQLLWDNGKVDLGTQTRGGDPSGINRGIFSRAADNIAIKPCGNEEVCFIEAYIWTNCDPVFGFLELYDNQCALPIGQPIRTATPTDVVPLDEYYTLDGVEYRGYLLKFWDIPWPLAANKNYWVAIGADGAGSFNARAFFAWADINDPCEGCNRRNLTYGAKLANRQASEVWLRGTREYAFRIATRPIDDDPEVTGPAINRCPPDFNRDGVVSIQDMFDYLTSFFQGCP